jgi:hypothetical protein
MDDYHEFQEEMPPKDAVIPNVEACDFKHQHLLALIFSRTTGYFQIDAPNAVDDWPGIMPSKVS